MNMGNMISYLIITGVILFAFIMVGDYERWRISITCAARVDLGQYEYPAFRSETRKTRLLDYQR